MGRGAPRRVHVDANGEEDKPGRVGAPPDQTERTEAMADPSDLVPPAPPDARDPATSTPAHSVIG